VVIKTALVWIVFRYSTSDNVQNRNQGAGENHQDVGAPDWYLLKGRKGRLCPGATEKGFISIQGGTSRALVNGFKTFLPVPRKVKVLTKAAIIYVICRAKREWWAKVKNICTGSTAVVWKRARSGTQNRPMLIIMVWATQGTV